MNVEHQEIVVQVKKIWNGISGRGIRINKSQMCEMTWCLWGNYCKFRNCKLKNGSQRMREIIKIDWGQMLLYILVGR